MSSALMNVFFRYTVNYYLFVWMCHGRTRYNRIFKLDEKFFFIIYHDKHSSFDRSLLERERFVSFGTLNLPILRLKCLKTQEKFKGIQKIQKEQYYRYSVFWIALRPVFNGTETIDFLVHNVWKLLIRNVWIYKSSK